MFGALWRGTSDMVAASKVDIHNLPIQLWFCFYFGEFGTASATEFGRMGLYWREKCVLRCWLTIYFCKMLNRNVRTHRYNFFLKLSCPDSSFFLRCFAFFWLQFALEENGETVSKRATRFPFNFSRFLREQTAANGEKWEWRRIALLLTVLPQAQIFR